VPNDNDRGQRAIDRHHDIESRLAERDAFEAGFRPSRKSGNLCRQFAGRTLTVFPRRDGRWGWSIFDSEDEEVEFSAETRWEFLMLSAGRPFSPRNDFRP
jgi:hypothetical protein